MIFCDDVSYFMNKVDFGRGTCRSLLVDTMEDELLRGRCFMQGFGGPLYTKICWIMRGPAMSVNELEAIKER